MTRVHFLEFFKTLSVQTKGLVYKPQQTVSQNPSQQRRQPNQVQVCLQISFAIWVVNVKLYLTSCWLLFLIPTSSFIMWENFWEGWRKKKLKNIHLNEYFDFVWSNWQHSIFSSFCISKCVLRPMYLWIYMVRSK